MRQHTSLHALAPGQAEIQPPNSGLRSLDCAGNCEQRCSAREIHPRLHERLRQLELLDGAKAKAKELGLWNFFLSLGADPFQYFHVARVWCTAVQAFRREWHLPEFRGDVGVVEVG